MKKVYVAAKDIFFGVHQHTTYVNYVIFYCLLWWGLLLLLYFHSTCDVNTDVKYFFYTAMLHFHIAVNNRELKLTYRKMLQWTLKKNKHVSKAHWTIFLDQNLLSKSLPLSYKHPCHTVCITLSHKSVLLHYPMLHSTFTVPQLLQSKPTNRADDHPASLSSKVLYIVVMALFYGHHFNGF